MFDWSVVSEEREQYFSIVFAIRDSRDMSVRASLGWILFFIFLLGFGVRSWPASIGGVWRSC